MTSLYINREKSLTLSTPNDNRKTRLKAVDGEVPTRVLFNNTGAGDLTLNFSDLDDPNVGNNSNWGDDITIVAGGSHETFVTGFTFLRVVRLTADTTYTVYAEYAG